MSPGAIIDTVHENPRGHRRPARSGGAASRLLEPEESRRAVPDSATSGPPTSDAIQSWLVQKISARLHVPAEQIRPAEPFTSFGLSSMVALSLSGELEELVGLQLPPTLMWDYPTIDSLSHHLAQLAADARPKRG